MNEWDRREIAAMRSALKFIDRQLGFACEDRRTWGDRYLRARFSVNAAEGLLRRLTNAESRWKGRA